MTKKKTVKELNEDVQVLQERVEKLEKIIEVFDILNSVKLNELEKKVEMMNDVRIDSKMLIIEKKINENSLCLKDLMSKKNMDDITVAKEYPCNYCEHKFKEKSKLKAHIKTQKK